MCAVATGSSQWVRWLLSCGGGCHGGLLFPASARWPCCTTKTKTLTCRCCCWCWCCSYLLLLVLLLPFVAAAAAAAVRSGRYVGEMSLLLPERRVVRFSVLDFWGNREVRATAAGAGGGRAGGRRGGGSGGGRLGARRRACLEGLWSNFGVRCWAAPESLRTSPGRLARNCGCIMGRGGGARITTPSSPRRANFQLPHQATAPNAPTTHQTHQARQS